MKKIISALLICAVVFLPLVFSGCSEKVDLISEYDGKVRTVEISCGNEESVLKFAEDGRILGHLNPTLNRRIAAVRYLYNEDGTVKCVERLDRDYDKVAERLFEYDENGLCVKVSTYNIKNEENVFDFAYEYKYDSNGNIIEIYDGNLTERYTYDENGLCVSENTFSKDGALQSEAVFSYNDSGKLVKTESTKGVSVYEYDADGRLVKEITDMYVSEYVYDENGAADVYVKYENSERKLTKRIEFFDDGKIVKETWLSGLSDDDLENISVFLVEELSELDPDPTLIFEY